MVGTKSVSKLSLEVFKLFSADVSVWQVDALDVSIKSSLQDGQAK